MHETGNKGIQLRRLFLRHFTDQHSTDALIPHLHMRNEISESGLIGNDPLKPVKDSRHRSLARFTQEITDINAYVA